MMQLWSSLVKFGFRLLYYEMSWTYDLISWIVSLGHWRDWQRVSIKYLVGSRILELAHGPGHLLLEMNKSGFQPVGVDLSPYMSRRALRRIRRRGVVIPLTRARAQGLPFPENSFDSLLSTFPAEFIIQDTTLEEANRVLCSGGRLVIIPQARLVGGGVTRKIIEWLFVLTGQRPIPEEDLANSDIWKQTESTFIKAGFNLTFELVRLENSIVTVLVAIKS